MLQTTKIEYVHNHDVFEAYCALNSSQKGKRPGVLVVHDWSGRNDFAAQKAEQLAEMGYVGFAVDMFGRGAQGKTKEEKMALMQPLTSDRNLLRGRIRAAYDTLRKLDAVNPARIAVIGFCFGGLCALDLARSGTEIRGAVSFHGLLKNDPNLPSHPIHAKILVLHGAADPMVPVEQVLEFEKEMTDAGVDWQLNSYGHVMHGFTNPQAHDPSFGTVYNSLADKRSWIAMREFFNEIFA